MKTKLFLNVAAIIVALIFCFQNANAQSWLLSGNSDATNSSKLGTLNNIPLKIYTNGKERMHITNAGNVGIGIASPTEKLHVAGNILSTGYITLSNSSLLQNIGSDF